MLKLTEIYKRIKNKGVKHVITYTIPWHINSLVNKCITIVVKKICIQKPLQDIIIIESHNDFDSNGGAFYDYLIENGYNERYKIVWFLRNKCPKNLPPNVKGYRYNFPSIKRVYYHCIAKYIIFGHFLIPSIREQQISCYTSHGAFGLKAFKGKIILPTSLSYCLCPSEYLAPILAEQYMLEYPNKKQIFVGYPCHDIFYTTKTGDLKKITSKKYSKVILWMPTFRKSVSSNRNDSFRDLPLGIPVFQDMKTYENLNARLREENILLILKLHPMQDLTQIKVKSLSNILVLDGSSVKRLGVDNYRLMKDIDALISDYSSVAYDFLHTGKPLAYTMDDVKDYKLGLIVSSPEELMAGPIIYNSNDFLKFIEDVIQGNDIYKEKRQLLFNKVFKYHDGNSSKRLAEFLNL